MFVCEACAVILCLGIPEFLCVQRVQLCYVWYSCVFVCTACVLMLCVAIAVCLCVKRVQ